MAAFTFLMLLLQELIRVPASSLHGTQEHGVSMESAEDLQGSYKGGEVEDRTLQVSSEHCK